MRASMEGVEAVAGRELPAEADADASGSLPTPAPAHTWGQLEGEGYGFCEENAGAGRNIQGVKVGWEMLTWVFSVDLSGRFLNGVRSGEQERALAHHCGRHSEVK